MGNLKTYAMAAVVVLLVMTCATSVILKMQLNTAEDRVLKQGETIITLTGINKSNQELQEKLLKRVDEVTESVTAMTEEREEALRRHTDIKRQLARLEANDAAIKGYLDGNVPASVGELFNVQQPAGGGVQRSTDKDSGDRPATATTGSTGDKDKP